MDFIDVSAEVEVFDEKNTISQPSVDAILPYQVPSTDIETIQLFQALHRPHQLVSVATTRKHQIYSRYVSAFQN
jgi:hypothetical protein